MPKIPKISEFRKALEISEVNFKAWCRMANPARPPDVTKPSTPPSIFIVSGTFKGRDVYMLHKDIENAPTSYAAFEALTNDEVDGVSFTQIGTTATFFLRLPLK